MRMVSQMLFDNLALNGFRSVKIGFLTENSPKLGVQFEVNFDTVSISK